MKNGNTQKIEISTAGTEREEKVQQQDENNRNRRDKIACACECKKKYRDKDGSEYKDLIKRLNRIEGQIRGIRNMVEENRYCVDILTQVSAVSSALNAFNKVLLAEHIKSCVVEDIQSGQEEAVDELCALLQKLMK
ncbi:MAG: metal-sensing transcriptional repressor [Lachnospiraceae bacterium]|nr:metal-sensing transcriptional repressor [Lachnospiraceae bacterium]